MLRALKMADCCWCLCAADASKPSIVEKAREAVGECISARKPEPETLVGLQPWGVLPKPAVEGVREWRA